MADQIDKKEMEQNHADTERLVIQALNTVSTMSKSGLDVLTESQIKDLNRLGSKVLNRSGSLSSGDVRSLVSIFESIDTNMEDITKRNIDISIDLNDLVSSYTKVISNDKTSLITKKNLLKEVQTIVRSQGLTDDSSKALLSMDSNSLSALDMPRLTVLMKALDNNITDQKLVTSIHTANKDLDYSIGLMGEYKETLEKNIKGSKFKDAWAKNPGDFNAGTMRKGAIQTILGGTGLGALDQLFNISGRMDDLFTTGMDSIKEKFTDKKKSASEEVQLNEETLARAMESTLGTEIQRSSEATASGLNSVVAAVNDVVSAIQDNTILDSEAFSESERHSASIINAIGGTRSSIEEVVNGTERINSAQLSTNNLIEAIPDSSSSIVSPPPPAEEERRGGIGGLLSSLFGSGRLGSVVGGAGKMLSKIPGLGFLGSAVPAAASSAGSVASSAMPMMGGILSKAGPWALGLAAAGGVLGGLKDLGDRDKAISRYGDDSAGSRLKTGAAGALSGITMGMVSDETMAKVVDAVVAGTKAIFSKDFWGRVWDAAKPVFVGMWDGVKALGGIMWDAIKEPILYIPKTLTGLISTFILAPLGNGLQNLGASITEGANSVCDFIGGIWDSVTAPFKSVAEMVVKGIDSVVEYLSNIPIIGTKIKAGWEATKAVGSSVASTVSGAVSSAGSAARGAVTGAASAVGGAITVAGQAVSQAASDAVTWSYGKSRASKMNPGFKSKLEAMAGDYKAKTGKNIVIGDTYRSNAEQAQAFANKPGLAAPPGKSMHEFGYAVDMSSKQATEADNMGLFAKYGLTRPMWPGKPGGKKEEWHVEPVEIQGKYAQVRGGASSSAAPTASVATPPPASPGDGLLAGTGAKENPTSSQASISDPSIMDIDSDLSSTVSSVNVDNVSMTDKSSSQSSVSPIPEVVSQTPSVNITESNASQQAALAKPSTVRVSSPNVTSVSGGSSGSGGNRKLTIDDYGIAFANSVLFA